MRSLLVALCLLLLSPLAGAWNAAGHRLTAAIAWQQLSPATREFVSAALARHPDHPRWVDKARSSEPAAIFAEAATWPDDIRNDPRFFDETRDDAGEPLPGFPDMARHKRWHYVDVDRRGRVVDGEADRQIERLDRLLRSTAKREEISYALPWLLHLVADLHQPLDVGGPIDDLVDDVDHRPLHQPLHIRRPINHLVDHIHDRALHQPLHVDRSINHVVDHIHDRPLHQPLHVGRHDDHGGNAVEIENPFNKRLPFASLHLYWDDLPGPPWLRGTRLEKKAQRLVAEYPPPTPGSIAAWRAESHALLAGAYPDDAGSLLPIVSEDFNRRAHTIANRRIVDAGYRLGWLLEAGIGARVSRETQ